MKSTINIFLIFSIFIAAKSSSAKKNVTAKFKPKQYVGLYDYFRNEIENLEKYEKKAFIDMKKRTSNGEYIPLYDEFKKRLDHFNAALILDSDKQASVNESRFSRFGDYKNLTENASNHSRKNVRLNRGFLNYFGFNKTAVEEDSNKKNQIMQRKQFKVQAKPYLKKHKKIDANFKTKNKIIFGAVKPGNLYDEYKRQIKLANDVFAKDIQVQRNSIFNFNE